MEERRSQRYFTDKALLCEHIGHDGMCDKKNIKCIPYNYRANCSTYKEKAKTIIPKTAKITLTSLTEEEQKERKLSCDIIMHPIVEELHIDMEILFDEPDEKDKSGYIPPKVYKATLEELIKSGAYTIPTRDKEIIKELQEYIWEGEKESLIEFIPPLQKSYKSQGQEDLYTEIGGKLVKQRIPNGCFHPCTEEETKKYYKNNVKKCFGKFTWKELLIHKCEECDLLLKCQIEGITNVE